MMFIPDKICVGFQERGDTYTGKLAYVIYYDKRGVLRKEASWNGWRDKKINPVDYPNQPTSGFVLNKKVGGGNSGWNSRNTYTRVFDPRGFEFEITVPNLLHILECCSSSPGKALEGEFVYAYEGKDLVLLPTNSKSYGTNQEYSRTQGIKLSTREYRSGCTYADRKDKIYTYVGYYPFYELYRGYRSEAPNGKKKHIFVKDNRYETNLHISKLVAEPVEGQTVVGDFYNSSHGTKAIGFIIRDTGKPTGKMVNGSSVSHYRDCWPRDESKKYSEYYRYDYGLVDGQIKSIRNSYSHYNNTGISQEEYDKLTSNLFVVLESGVEIPL